MGQCTQGEVFGWTGLGNGNDDGRILGGQSHHALLSNADGPTLFVRVANPMGDNRRRHRVDRTTHVLDGWLANWSNVTTGCQLCWSRVTELRMEAPHTIRMEAVAQGR